MRRLRPPNPPKPSDSAPAKPARPSPSPSGTPEKNASIPVPHKEDVAGQRRVSKHMYLDWLGGRVLTRQTMHAIKEDEASLEAAHAFVAALKESVQPRDAIEEMLLLQMAWTHARVGRLTRLAADQTSAPNVRVVNDAADRAANTFRRMVQGLAEYRRPPQSNPFVAIKQANVANQQVVQNVQHPAAQPEKQSAPASNEQGLPPAALPPVCGGLGVTPGDGSGEQALAGQHRPSDGKGEKSVER